ncbi:hypothetical protein LZ32DRAFT_641732 [Colletotrichum eremochloae]|nr:hypothetical protein LZ32DRAFT_641732 [Colletotrichum eremochloae]
MVSEIHVISKRDITKHETLAVDISMPPLAASSVRIRTSLIGITANNFTYAKLGSILQWWNTWPVPVLESTVNAIPTGGLLYGYWPTSSHPVYMKLEPAEPSGHFREISEHRKGLGSLYNHYNLRGANVYHPWNGGYVLNRFTFATDFKPVHPLAQGAGEWTDQDADLSSAVVVSLSAASRTARSFTWNLARNRKPGNGPLALLQATSVPLSLTPAFESGFEIKAVNYDGLVSQARVVVADFGGPPNVTEKLLESIKSTLPESAVITNLLVGAEPKVASRDKMVARMHSQKKWGTVQLNTTAAVDAGIAAEGAEQYHQENVSAFERSLKENVAGDLELAWGSGVGGANGVEKAWGNLAKGTLSFNKAWVYRLEQDA